jgi:predicted PurR-regulated permease PerM
MQFSYQLVDRLDIVQVSIIYSVSIFVFVLLVGLLMVLTARYCIQQVIKQNQDYWKRMAVEMSNIVRSAQRIKETGGSIPPPPIPRGGDYRGNFNPPPNNYDNRSR